MCLVFLLHSSNPARLFLNCGVDLELPDTLLLKHWVESSLQGVIVCVQSNEGII